MEWFALGWRDGVLLLVALAAIYLVFMLLRLTQVGRRQGVVSELDEPITPKADLISRLRRRAAIGTKAEAGVEDTVAAHAVMVATTPPPAADHALEMPREAPPAVPPAPTFAWDEVNELLRDAVAPGPASSAAPRTGGFGEHLAEHLARSEVEMEVQRMRDDMERMRAEMEELRVARRVSPQYAEAMELAQRGLNAQDVADRLGISLAEAELVHALSRGDKNFDEGGEDGEDRYVASDEFDAFDGRRTSGRR